MRPSGEDIHAATSSSGTTKNRLVPVRLWNLAASHRPHGWGQTAGAYPQPAGTVELDATYRATPTLIDKQLVEAVGEAYLQNCQKASRSGCAEFCPDLRSLRRGPLIILLTFQYLSWY